MKLFAVKLVHCNIVDITYQHISLSQIRISVLDPIFILKLAHLVEYSHLVEFRLSPG